MKLVHSDHTIGENWPDWLQRGRELEANGERKEAATWYERVIKADPLRETAYDRLLIIYRKEKELARELTTVKKAIKAFEEMYSNARPKKAAKQIVRLSNALSKMTGLMDKKGKLIDQPEPIARWMKRKAVIEKRLNK